MAKKQKRYFLLYSGNKRFYNEGGTLLEKMNQDSNNAWKNAGGKNLGNSISGVASGVTGMVSGIMDVYDKTSSIYKDDTVEQAQQDIDALANTNYTDNDSYDTLLDQWSGINLQDTDWQRSDLMAGNGWDVFGQSISGTGSAMLSGAQAGASVGGPWGAIAGAAAGLIGGIGAGIGGFQEAKNKADRAAERLNAEAEKANTAAINNMNRQASAITDASYQNMRQNIMAEGGKIHIKPENRGKFTALKKRTGKSASWFKEHGTPAQRKMATFALNARKWKHAYGGKMDTDFTNGVTTINNGGIHEENPMEGVPMGIAPDGLPNLVEEGETIYNDYVFSNRIKAPKELKKKLRLTGSTFSDIAKSAQKESEERPNDPISKRGLEDIMNKLQTAQESIKQIEQNKEMRKYAKGGKLGHKFDGGGSFDIEKFRDSIIYGKNKATPISDFEADLRNLDTEGWDRLNSLLLANTGLTPEQAMNYMNVRNPDTEDTGDADTLLPTWMRYVAAAGPAIGAIASLATPPDYSNSDILIDAANNLSQDRVRFKPINNYLTYRPIDRNYQLNELRSQAGATRRSIMNSGSNAGQTMAGLLAADYNAQRGIGDALTKMEMYNEQNRQRVADFNRQTNMYNSQGRMQASQANAGLATQRDKLRLSALGPAAQMREATDTARLNSIYGNVSGMFENLGNIGNENFVFNTINSNDAWRYKLPTTGGLGYKGAKGGKLLTKKRRKH